jgi:segregation and condensation protein B
MKRGKKKDGTPEAIAAEDTAPAVVADADGDVSWDGPTRAGEAGEIADLLAEASRPEGALAGDGEVSSEVSGDISIAVEDPADAAVWAEEGDGAAEGAADAVAAEGRETGDLDGEPEPVVESAWRLESILESLLYASDRPLTVADLKRLVNERDGKKLAAALEALRERHAETGIQLASLAGGWQFRTHPENGPWVAKLVAGRPQRLSRAMLETLSIVAYRQPITRPEIDEIRGVDCGPVLKTLLDRGFVRILGKKEDVGRPMLYGTTPEFLKTFSLRDLSELPTLREFHELSEQQMATVDAQAPLPQVEGAAPPEPARSPFAPTSVDLAPVDQDEEDDLLEALDSATIAATRASGPPPGTTAEAGAAPESSEA